jgi:K+-sensing histidine kinase KdpD
MSRDDELFYLGAGPVAAIALGAALIPLRELTTASNLAFAFLLLTIVAGHAGGRWPATATAVTSALSLNFFLTRPYLTLTIHGRDDVIAFLGLAACGLVSAALGSGSGRRLASRRQLGVLYSAARDLEVPGPAASRVQQVLESAHAAFPVAALALYDENGQLLACAGDRTRVAGIPRAAADDDLLSDAGAATGRRGGSSPLPREGVRVPLVVGQRALGSLDVWGDGRAAGPDTRRTLRALARVVAALVAAERNPLPAAGGPEQGRSAWVALPRRSDRE